VRVGQSLVQHHCVFRSEVWYALVEIHRLCGLWCTIRISEVAKRLHLYYDLGLSLPWWFAGETRGSGLDRGELVGEGVLLSC